jgi:membrane protein implicated in regulation of membrane protease activity
VRRPRPDAMLLACFVTVALCGGALAVSALLGWWPLATLFAACVVKLAFIVNRRAIELMEREQRDGYRQCTADVGEMQRLAKRRIRPELRVIDGGRS